MSGEDQKRGDPIIRALWLRRKTSGRTLADVAARSGLSKTAINEAENGHHVPGLISLRRWSAALDLRLELVEDDLAPHISNETHEALMRKEREHGRRLLAAAEERQPPVPPVAVLEDLSGSEG
jgi:transcriptional regulator with XRE-family HTH domain